MVLAHKYECCDVSLISELKLSLVKPLTEMLVLCVWLTSRSYLNVLSHIYRYFRLQAIWALVGLLYAVETPYLGIGPVKP